MTSLIIDSTSERKLTRSVHFDGMEKDEALQQAAFYQEQIGYYLANTFNRGATYTVTCELRSDADRTYTISKGSAILTVETVFGLNRSYRESPPRIFYTFTTTVSHRNDLLDTTAKANEVIEWAFRIGGGLVLGVTIGGTLIFFGGPLSGHLAFIGFSFGSAVGGVVGQLISNRIYNSVEQRLDAKGEVTEIETEWNMLTETVDILITETPHVTVSHTLQT